jgi:hypothetical protein
MTQDNGTGALLGGSGATAFPFPNPGSRLKGKVVVASVVNQTLLDDGPTGKKGDTVYWDAEKTQPKQAVRATIRAEIPTERRINFTDTFGRPQVAESETGEWSVFFSGNKFTQLRKASPKGLFAGDDIDIIFTEYSDRAPKERGHSPAKLYSVTVVPAPVGTGPLAGPIDVKTTVVEPPAQVANQGTHGPKPDYLPQAAWDAMPAEARATVSPFVAQFVPAATYGAKPDYLPQAAWDAMPEAARIAVSPPGEPAPVRPDFIPEAAWNVMDEAARKLATVSPV